MKTFSLLIACAAFSVELALHAANTNYYYDLNGTTPGSGVINGGNYSWGTNDVVWNTNAAGGTPSITLNWFDCGALGLTSGTTLAAQNTSRANFSAGAAGLSYTVTIPAGEMRDFNLFVANRETVTLTGGSVRPQGANTFNSGFRVVNPGGFAGTNAGRLTLSNLVINVSASSFIICQGNNFAGLIRFGEGVVTGLKQYSIQNYGTLDLGGFLNNNQIFTTNYPYGGAGGNYMAGVFFNGDDNNVLQGNGLLTLPVMPAGPFSGPYPWVGWNGATSGGFAGRGGKLTVNLHGDGRTLSWGGTGFIQSGQGLILNSYYADSEVDFRNGIDLGSSQRAIKVLGGLPGSFATISGVISGAGGGITKASQSGAANGTLILAATNTYTGPTTVSEGALWVDGSLASGSVVGVASGASLGGTGVINGALVISNGASLTPGKNGLGTLTAANTVTLSGVTRMEINRASLPNADKLNRTGGALSFGGILTVTNIGGALASGNVFDLFDAASFSGAFTATNLPPGGSVHWDTSQLGINGTIMFTNNPPAVPALSMGAVSGVTALLKIIDGKMAPTDQDPGDTLSVSSTGTPGHGAAATDGTNIIYTPNVGFVGNDAFQYVVTDNLGARATNTVTVAVTPSTGLNQLAIESLGGGMVRLNYLGIPGTNYALDWRTNLTLGDWVPIVTNPAAGNGYLIFTNNGSAPANFYRTRYVP